MWPYWLMFLLPAVAALNERGRRSGARGRLATLRIPPIWWGVMLALTLLVGWRHEVGGDWQNYLGHLYIARIDSHTAEWWWNDPGYRLLEWLAVQGGLGIYTINLMGAAIFSVGLVVFCRHLPRPWLALAVAVPYLVIILGMGYNRQGVALGCIMVGLVALGNGQVRKFVLWALLGATFHKSAVLLLPMAALAASRNRWLTAVWVAVAAALAYVVLLADSIEQLKAGYLDAGYQSEGALIRLVMNALPAALLLWKRERFVVSLSQGRLWLWFALLSIAMLGLYFVTPSTTALDRVALYMLPLQLMVFSHLPEVLGSRRGRNQAWVGAILLYYATVEFVWLNFATHAFAWLPYRFYPLEVLF